MVFRLGHATHELVACAGLRCEQPPNGETNMPWVHRTLLMLKMNPRLGVVVVFFSMFNLLLLCFLVFGRYEPPSSTPYAQGILTVVAFKKGFHISSLLISTHLLTRNASFFVTPMSFVLLADW